MNTILTEARRRSLETHDLARKHLNPALVDVLQILGFDVCYERACGSCLYTTEGVEVLDMHAGEGFATLGHNHPQVKAVLQEVLEQDLPGGVQIQFHVLSGMLAEALCRRMPGSLDAVYFCSSGAEAVDAAMKFARVSTGRPRFLSCHGGYHGVHLGPLSICGEPMFQERFGPLLPGCAQVPHGDLTRLEEELRRRDVAAFILEPILGLGVSVPSSDYLPEVQRLCRKYGTLFVMDEIQTGLGRTGKWLALEHWNLEPDMVLLSKCLSGGYVPLAAMVTRREIYNRLTNRLERCYVHESTFGRNTMAMAAGLATLHAIEEEGLIANAELRGMQLRAGLLSIAGRHPWIVNVRGLGLMTAFDLGEPASFKRRMQCRAIRAASPGLLAQLLVIPLFRDHHILTMVSSKNDCIKLLPPLGISEAQVQQFLSGLEAVLEACETEGSGHWIMLFEILQKVGVQTLRKAALPLRSAQSNGKVTAEIA